MVILYLAVFSLAIVLFYFLFLGRRADGMSFRHRYRQRRRTFPMDQVVDPNLQFDESRGQTDQGRQQDSK